MEGRVIVATSSSQQSQSGQAAEFYYDGARWTLGAPRVMAALAGLVHDAQSAADYEHNHDKNT